MCRRLCKAAVRVVLPVLAALAIASHAAAQITAATVGGTVKDESGAVLPGVSVTVKNTATGLTRSAVTDSDGFFTIPGLPPGTYESRATLSGFATALEKIALAVAQQAGLTFTLKIGGAEETITVVGTSPLLDTRSAALSAVVTEKTIEQLPLNGRNYIDLALLQPGVTSFAEKDSSSSSNRGTKLNINGMGFRSNSYLLDGANMRGYAGTATVSAAETTLGVETISEFRVVTNAYSADYGRSMGGVISVVTKTGSNDIRGSAFEFFRDSAMDSRNFFDRGDPAPFTRHQFGGTVGGPIRRNKLFFFGGIERLQEDLSTTTLTTVPSEAARSGALFPINPVVRPYLEMYPLPNGRQLAGGIAEYTFEFNNPTRENFYQGRVDYTLSDKDTVFGRYTYDGADQSVPVGFAQFGTNSVSRNQFLTLEHKRILSSTLLNTARFSHSRLRFEQLPSGPSTPDLAFLAGQDLIGTITLAGVLTTLGGTGNNPSTNNSYYWTFSNDLSYAKGRHLLKVGMLAEHLRTDKLTATNIRGAYVFADLQRFLAGTATRFTGVVPGAELNRSRPNTLFGFYAQDDFRMSSRVTLNLGLRYEFYTLPRDLNGFDTSLLDTIQGTAFTPGELFAENPSKKNIAPRIGFAWDVTGDGRTSIRGGAGVYHDTDGPFNSAFGIASFSPPFAPVAQINNPPFPRPNIAAGALNQAARTIDYNIKQPYAVTYNASVQRQMFGDMVFMVGYAGSRGYNLLTAIEGNPFVPTIQTDGSKFWPAGARRRNPAFAAIDFRTNGGRSEYHALQTSAQKRFAGNYQLQVSYTLSKAEDNTQAQLSADVNNSSVYAQDPYDRDADWARADFDVRHVTTANFVWELPGRADHVLFGGWQFNGIVTLRTGVPFTPALGGTNWSRSGNTSGQDRPNLRPGVNPDDLILGGADRYFDPAGYVLQPQGTLGNAGRNSLTGPGYAMTNLSFVKNTKAAFLGTSGQIQFRLEVFNLLNKANFAVPERVVFSAATANDQPLSTAGRLTRTVTSSRQLQLGVKVIF